MPASPGRSHQGLGRGLDVELIEDHAPLVGGHLLDDVGDVRGWRSASLAAGA